MGKTQEECKEKMTEILSLFRKEERWTVSEVENCLAITIGFVCYDSIERADKQWPKDEKMDATIDVVCVVFLKILIPLIQNQSESNKLDETTAKKIYQVISSYINNRKTEGEKNEN